MRILLTILLIFFCQTALCYESLLPGTEENQGVKLFHNAKYNQAAEYFEQQIDLGGELTELAHLYLAKYSILKNDGKSAVEHIEHSLAIKPNQVQELLLAAEAHCTMAMQISIFSALKLGKRCGKYYDLAASEEPLVPRALKSAVQFHWEAPSVAGGSKKRAQLYLQQLTAIAEEDARILNLLQKEQDEGEQSAIALADHYAGLDYLSTENLYELAIFYRDRNQTQKAINQFERVTKLKPHNQRNWHYSDAVFQLGEQYIDTESHKDAGIALIEQYLETSTDIYDPHYFWARWRLARSYRDRGDMEQYHKLVAEINEADFSHNEAFAKAFESATK